MTVHPEPVSVDVAVDACMTQMGPVAERRQVRLQWSGATGLVVLADPKSAIPSYDALVLISPKRAKDTRLAGALVPLIGKISVERMREANLMVDRDIDKKSPKEAAQFLAKSLGLSGN